MTQRPQRSLRYLAAVAAGAAIFAAGIDYWPTRTEIPWLTLDEAKQQARESGKPIFLDVYADWCAPCRLMDKTVFTEDSVREMLTSRYIPARLNIDDPAATDSIKKRLRIHALPTSILISPAGLLLDRQVGFVPASDLLTWLGSISWEDYGPLQPFAAAMEHARATGKPVLLLAFREIPPQETLKKFFQLPEARALLGTQTVPSLLVYDAPDEKAILDSLRVLPQQIPQGGTLALIFDARGNERARVPIRFEELAEPSQAVTKLLPYGSSPMSEPN